MKQQSNNNLEKIENKHTVNFEHARQITLATSSALSISRIAKDTFSMMLTTMYAGGVELN